MLSRLHGADMRLGVGDHRAELVDVERDAVASRSLLAIEHWTAVLELDESGDDGPQRSRSDETDPRKRHIQGALGQQSDAASQCRRRRLFGTNDLVIEGHCRSAHGLGGKCLDDPLAAGIAKLVAEFAIAA